MSPTAEVFVSRSASIPGTSDVSYPRDGARRRALELELKRTMDAQLELMVDHEMSLRGYRGGGAGTWTAYVGSGEAGGVHLYRGESSDWSKRAAAMELELKWGLGERGAGVGPPGSRSGLASSASLFSAEDRVQGGGLHGEREVAVQRLREGRIAGSNTAPLPETTCLSPAQEGLTEGLRGRCRELEGKVEAHAARLREMERWGASARVGGDLDPAAAELARENERLVRENAALRMALVRSGGNDGMTAVCEALALARADLQRAGGGDL